MRAIASIILFVIATTLVRAATPEETARGYMEAMKAGDLERVALYMHPAALAKFKEILEQFAKRLEEIGATNDPKSKSAARVLFGDAGPAAVPDTDAKTLFVQFLGAIQKAAPMMQQVLANSTNEFIGHVDEGENQTHVVYRATMTASGAEVTKVDVLTLKRDGEQWGVTLTGDIERLVGGLSRQFDKK